MTDGLFLRRISTVLLIYMSLVSPASASALVKLFKGNPKLLFSIHTIIPNVCDRIFAENCSSCNAYYIQFMAIGKHRSMLELGVHV
jgi:hypothetical protein